jgi:glycosyltransferase involved in cell wall biosynthesis
MRKHRQVKVLHVIASADPRSGGPIEGILRQNEALAGAGVREVVSLDSPSASFLKNFPISIHPVGTRPQGQSDRNRIARFGFTPRLVPWLRENVRKYDAVVVNGLWNYASVGASRVLPTAGVPYFVFTHGMMDPWFRRNYPFKHLQKQAFWLAFEGRLLSHARAVLFTTEEERRLAEGEFWGHRYQARVVGYGTSPPPAPTPAQFAAFNAAVPSLLQRPYLLFLSRIHEKKGCDLLIKAYAECVDLLGDLQLVIAGPDRDGLQPKLNTLARSLGIAERIHWAGMLTGDAKWGAMRSAEAFILPSHQENFGIAVAEALGCGIPVLTTDRVNIWREVEAGGAGLIATDTVDGILALLKGFLDLSREARAKMGEAGRAVFAAHFDVNAAAQNLLEVIRDATHAV